MRTEFIETLMDVAQRDERVWLLTADLGYSVLEPFMRRFPARYVNVGVAEQNLIGVAAGLARCGAVPFVYSIANFPTIRCLEQIRNDVCHYEAPVKIIAVGGGLAYGSAGYTHHGVEDLAVMRSLPGMTLVAPADPVEARSATQAVAALPGPCYLRLGKANEPRVYTGDVEFEIGKAIVVRQGADATIVSTGSMLTEAVAAADGLRRQGVSVRVLSMHTLKPIDAAAIVRCARETAAIVTVEEHSVVGGLGSATAEVLARSGIGTRLENLGIPDRPYRVVGSQPFLRRQLIGDLTVVVLKLLADQAGRRRKIA